MVFERVYLHYYAIIIIFVEKGLKTAILSLMAGISGTINRPAKFVIVTGLLTLYSIFHYLISLSPFLSLSLYLKSTKLKRALLEQKIDIYIAN